MSSSSDSDDIEIDGFPPESANAARFTSMKSTTEAGQAQRCYLPINSWSIDVPPEDMIRNCVKALKEPGNVTEEEKFLLLEQLEGHLMSIHESQTSDSLWKSTSVFPKSPLKKPEFPKPPSVKINIEIPALNATQSNIKYSVDQPIYDSDKLCWRTGMDFIFQNPNPPIVESEHEIPLENKSTQSENEFQSLRDSFVFLPKPICHDTRCRSEEKLISPDIVNIDSLSERLGTDSEFSFLEKIEENLHDFKNGGRFSTFKSSFRKYKDVIENSLHKHAQEIKKLKTENDGVINFSYDKLTESQFKRHSQNQLLLLDVEQEINVLNADINKRELNFEKMAKFRSITEDSRLLENEINQTRFAKSLRLISQMINNLRSQVSALTNELKNTSKRKPSLNITL